MTDPVLAALQEKAGPDLVVGYVVIARTETASEPGLNGYLHLWDGPVDTRLGLLRYAALRTERLVTTEDT